MSHGDDWSWCSGEIKGNADVAGIGVIVGIWVTNGIGVLLGYAWWYMTVFRKSTLVDSAVLRVLSKCAAVVGDLSMTTALAIICTSIILIKGPTTLSLYHLFTARCLVQNCFAGLGSALIYDVEHKANWWSRMFLLIATAVLYIWWTVMSIKEFYSWSGRTPACFYNSSYIPGSYTSWMRFDMFWLPVSWLWYLLEPFPRYEHYLVMVNGFVPRYWTYSRKLWNLFFSKRNAGWRKWFRMPGFIVALIVQFFGAIFVILFVCPPSVDPLSTSIFYAWSIYDLWAVRMSNRHIVTDYPAYVNTTVSTGDTSPESEWQFGQLLPVFLLLTTILGFVDVSIDEHSENKKHNSPNAAPPASSGPSGSNSTPLPAAQSTPIATVPVSRKRTRQIH